MNYKELLDPEQVTLVIVENTNKPMWHEKQSKTIKATHESIVVIGKHLYEVRLDRLWFYNKSNVPTLVYQEGHSTPIKPNPNMEIIGNADAGYLYTQLKEKLPEKLARAENEQEKTPINWMPILVIILGAVIGLSIGFSLAQPLYHLVPIPPSPVVTNITQSLVTTTSTLPNGQITTIIQTITSGTNTTSIPTIHIGGG